MDVNFYLSDVHVGDFGLVSEEVNPRGNVLRVVSAHFLRALQYRDLSYVDVKVAITATWEHWT